MAARRARTAQVLGRARVFLTDADPDRLGINVNAEATPKLIEALEARLNVLRDEVSVFAAEADDDHLTTRAAELEVALFNALHWASGKACGLRPGIAPDTIASCHSCCEADHLFAGLPGISVCSCG